MAMSILFSSLLRRWSRTTFTVSGRSERDRRPGPGLGDTEADIMSDRGHGLALGRLAGVKVEVRPSQPEDLAPARPRYLHPDHQNVAGLTSRFVMDNDFLIVGQRYRKPV
jgi:hypothetical protein